MDKIETANDLMASGQVGSADTVIRTLLEESQKESDFKDSLYIYLAGHQYEQAKLVDTRRHVDRRTGVVVLRRRT